jgi:hypothetical protein
MNNTREERRWLAALILSPATRHKIYDMILPVLRVPCSTGTMDWENMFLPFTAINTRDEGGREEPEEPE